MTNYCFVTPILPGGEKLMREWVDKNIRGSKDHDSQFKGAGISREQVWIQRTPMGDFAVVSFEVHDPVKAFTAIATSKDPWMGKFRELLKKAHGVDVTKPTPPNEQILDWHEGRGMVTVAAKAR